MAASASTRVSIRWPPEAASEPTHTLVLSLGGYYVDLRVQKSDGRSIDWALAGKRIVISENPSKVEFTHTIDSHSLSRETDNASSDVGEFTKLDNGDDLETGTMPAPHRNGEVAAYEEIWRELDFRMDDTEESTVAWILETKSEGDGSLYTGPNSKAFFARVGKFYLAVGRTEREVQGEIKRGYRGVWMEYDSEREAWSKKYVAGELDAPPDGCDDAEKKLCSVIKRFEAGVKKHGWKVGDLVLIEDDNGDNGETCIIRAMEGTS